MSVKRAIGVAALGALMTACEIVGGFEDFSAAAGGSAGAAGTAGSGAGATSGNAGAGGGAGVSGTAGASGSGGDGGTVCAVGEKRCVGDVLERCNSARNGFDELATCASSALCLQARDGDGATCPEPVCGGGKPLHRCLDGAVETCNATATGFDRTPCGVGTVCNPANGTCVALPIDASEVTRASYRSWATSAGTTGQPAACTWNTSFAPDSACITAAAGTDCIDDKLNGAIDARCDAYPQTCIDWCDAVAYCASKGQHLCGRLGKPGETVPLLQYSDPGQSEWMNRCSSGGQHTWVTGAAIGADDCNGELHWPATPQPVNDRDRANCQSPVTRYQGALNLAGNVAEWENSCDTAITAPDARGDLLCRARGGSYLSTLDELRCSASLSLPRSATRKDVGFRCCGTPN